MISPSFSVTRAARSQQSDLAKSVSRRERLVEASIFLIGLSSAFYTKAGGTLFLLDVIFLCVAAGALFAKSKQNIVLVERLLFCFLGVWFLGAMVSDVVNQTPPQNYLRGWGKIATFTMALIAVIRLINGKLQRLAYYLMGIAAASALQAALFPNPYQAGEPWKFGFAIPIATAAMAALAIRKRPSTLVVQCGLPFVLAILNLVLNYRSLFVILLAVTAIVGLAWYKRMAFGARKVMYPMVATATLLVLAIGGWGVQTTYSAVASSGMLGQKALDKYNMQTRGDLGLLLGGRKESLVSTRAIADAPFLGHGSWASDSRYNALMVLMLRERGVETNGTIKSEVIPSHSYFFGSWVEAGIAGAIFWAFCFVISLVALPRLIDLTGPSLPLLALCTIQLLWNIPFSPFGADSRFTVAAQLVAVIAVLNAWNTQLSSPQRAQIKR